MGDGSAHSSDQAEHQHKGTFRHTGIKPLANWPKLGKKRAAVPMIVRNMIPINTVITRSNKR